MTIPPLKVRNLSVQYGGRTALEDFSWNAPERGLVAIVGPNGAGKSTLLKAVLGLVTKASGDAEVFGKPISDARDQIAYVPQRASVDWDFPATAADVVAMGLYRKIGWLKPVRATDRRPPNRCAFGRAAAARVSRPRTRPADQTLSAR
jgi:manganese/zinc/iron transport system ATP- binding protein